VQRWGSRRASLFSIVLFVLTSAVGCQDDARWMSLANETGTDVVIYAVVDPSASPFKLVSLLRAGDVKPVMDAFPVGNCSAGTLIARDANNQEIARISGEFCRRRTYTVRRGSSTASPS
jgi:hypothetical protein